MLMTFRKFGSADGEIIGPDGRAGMDPVKPLEETTSKLGAAQTGWLKGQLASADTFWGERDETALARETQE
jgi:phosphodiesterase/alkaline phosphatase D-like protein